MNRLKKMFLAVLIIPLLVVGLATSALSISDLGNPAVTRLWIDSGDEPDQFACTASYIQPFFGNGGSWILSAGHCSIARYAKRNADTTIIGGVNWRAVFDQHNTNIAGQDLDLALGTVPETRSDGEQKRLFLADKAPDNGIVYVHGFPAGVEKVVVAQVIPVGFEDRFSFLTSAGEMMGYTRVTAAETFPGTRVLLVHRKEIGPGSSGSPVLDMSGRVVGIVWGGVRLEHGLQGPGTEENDVALYTPIERVHEIMKFMKVK